MIVIDCSVAVEALLGRPRAQDWLSSTATFAPHLIDAEIVQALRGLARRGHLETSHGTRLVDTWRRLGVVRFAVHPLAARMWEMRDNLTAYDAGYAALAEELGCSLLTADERLARAPGLRCDVTLLER